MKQLFHQIALLVLLGCSPAMSDDRDTRMAWWREAKFGMFIHWGIYSVPAGVYQGKQIPHAGEWIMNSAKIPVARYAEYAREFNPTKFDAEAWVKIAKDAGMRYIVITAKHHDGFAMYPSHVSPFNIRDATPFGRDPLKELADACRKEGIKLGFYYSQAQDWHHPGGAALFKGHWDKAQDGSMDDYIDKVAVPQVRELLANYGEFPSVLWWDSGEAGMNRERAAKFQKLVRELRPDIIMNNRLGGGIKGDTETPEQRIPVGGYKGRDWETCMTMDGSWGHKSYGEKPKSTETLLFNLIDIASKGGNYLLNVGPTAEGVIPPESVDHLAGIGRWMKINGDAIYGSRPTCFGAEYGPPSQVKIKGNAPEQANSLGDWRCTTKPGRIYIHIFHWHPGNLDLPPVRDVITHAYLLADAKRTPLGFRQTTSGVSIVLPGHAPDAIASVVCLECGKSE